MVKMFGKIHPKLDVERSGPEGFKGGLRSDACKSLLGIVVRGIRYEGLNLQIAMEVFGMCWEVDVGRGMWGGRYNSLQTDFKELVKSNQNMIVFSRSELQKKN